VADFIREVFHPEWLFNPILVHKKNTNEWRMCVDYTDLNKDCPKDPFGLPRIDQVIDSTVGCDLLCFIDCYSGYQQIAVKEEDQETTVFITPFGTYYYTMMSIGLKNAGAPYQRAIQACFKKQLNKNVEASVDDLVVKTRNSDTLIADPEETFASLWEYQWKLNPNKCVFGMPSSKLLGFIISHRSIEANPEKISSITKMKAPTYIKDVQKLTGCMASLNRFISRLEERGLPFFKLLKHQEKFVWTTEVEQALAQLKDFLSKPPIITSPAKMSSYCSILLRLLMWSVLPSLSSGRKTTKPTQSSDQSTSSARSCQSQRHATNLYKSYSVRCTSPRKRYDTTSRSTRSSSSPSTRSATSYGTKMILERISKWAVELGALNIDFKPRKAIKSQALVDFMTEWQQNQLPTPTERPEHWVMYFDGPSSSKARVQWYS
jgi:hypothetical protein